MELAHCAGCQEKQEDWDTPSTLIQNVYVTYVSVHTVKQVGPKGHFLRAEATKGRGRPISIAPNTLR